MSASKAPVVEMSSALTIKEASEMTAGVSLAVGEPSELVQLCSSAGVGADIEMGQPNGDVLKTKSGKSKLNLTGKKD